MAEDPLKKVREKAEEISRKAENLGEAGNKIAEAIEAARRQAPPRPGPTPQPPAPEPRRILSRIQRLPKVGLPFMGRRAVPPEESKIRKLKEKWSEKKEGEKRIPSRTLDKGADLIGRAVIPDRTIRKAFKGPLTQPTPPEGERPVAPPPAMPHAPPGPEPGEGAPPLGNVRLWGRVFEAYPSGGQQALRPVAGAVVTFHRMSGMLGFGRGAGGTLRRFFGGQQHGPGIASTRTGEDGKFDLRFDLNPDESPLLGNLVARRPGYEENSSLVNINLTGGAVQGDVTLPGGIRIPIASRTRFELTPAGIVGRPAVPSYENQNQQEIQLILLTTGRPRKAAPFREQARREFYTHFGWSGLLWTLIWFGVLTTLYELLIGPILGTFGLEASPLFRIGGAIAILLFSVFAFRGRGNWGILRPLLPFLLIFLLIWGVFGLRHWSDLTNFEWYLGQLDKLNIIGVPQDTIDNVKDGIRNVLSFLHFKAVEPTKPEAKKIGGFEAIQLKFGSKYNDYLLPTMFARMDYTLPITVTNPNKFDTKLVVKNFVIGDIFLNNKSDQRILCGSVGESPELTGMIALGDINPEEERLTTTDFKGKTTQNNGVPYIAPAVGSTVDCRTIPSYKPRPTNPLFPVRVDVTVIKKEECTTANKDNVCKPIVDNFKGVYGLDLTVADVRAKGDTVCECKINRHYNIMDELCLLDNNKAKITLVSNYGFSVQGKGELILVKTDADRKLAPKPSITSSAGPLTVTTYFVSDVHVPEKNKPKTTRMFIQIANDGDGTAQINEIKFNKQNLEGLTIGTCSPSPDNVKVPVPKDGTTISCSMAINDSKIVNAITGSYLTLPMIVDIDYTYSQTHSTTINVKKESIPESLTFERKEELRQQFELLPYYCPSDLKIYNPEIK